MIFLRFTFPCLAVLTLPLVFLHEAAAQEIPRPSLIRRLQKEPPTDYNIKVGQVLLTAFANVSGEFNDNVYLSSTRVESDYVISPEFGLNAAWQVTQLNVLQMKTAFAYAKYVDHPDLDSENLTVAPSTLSFAVFIGDVRVEVHDNFSLQSDTSQDGAPGGVARLPRFNNTAGVSVLWDMNDLMWSLGYDHYNFVTLGSAVSTSGEKTEDLTRLDHSTDQISTSVVTTIATGFTLGLEGTVSHSDYPNEPGSNYTSFSVGPLLEMQLTTYSAISFNAGFKAYSFESGPATVGLDEDGFLTVIPGEKPGLAEGYYASFTWSHRMNRFYADQFEFGHDDQADALSGRTVTNYARYSSNWTLNSSWSIRLSLFWEDVQVPDQSGPVGGGQTDYTHWGGQISTGYQLTKHASLSLSYQYTQRDSDDNQGYLLNRMAMTVGYKF